MYFLSPPFASFSFLICSLFLFLQSQPGLKGHPGFPGEEGGIVSVCFQGGKNNSQCGNQTSDKSKRINRGWWARSTSQFNNLWPVTLKPMTLSSLSDFPQGERGSPGPTGPQGLQGCPGRRGLKVSRWTTDQPEIYVYRPSGLECYPLDVFPTSAFRSQVTMTPC